MTRISVLAMKGSVAANAVLTFGGLWYSPPMKLLRKKLTFCAFQCTVKCGSSLLIINKWLMNSLTAVTAHFKCFQLDTGMDHAI